MNEPMQKYFKPGLIHYMAYPDVMKGEGNIVETVKRVACDDYFSAIEITWIKDLAVRKEVKKIIETSRIAVAYGSQPRMLTTGMNINDLNAEKRKQALSSLKQGIDEAYEIGAVGFSFLSGKYEEETKEQSYQALVDSTKELCEYAMSKGSMPVTLEVFDYDIDKKSIIGPADLANRYAKEITREYKNFGLLVDLSHIPMLHETCEESLLPNQEYITHAHMGNTVIKDASLEAYGDTHPRFGFPNSENDVDELVEYLRVLFKIGYLNKENPHILSMEVKPWKDEDPELIIASSKRTLNEAWAKLEI